MVVQLLNMKRDSFRHREKYENLLCPEEPYLSSIDGLMSLANCIVHVLLFSQFISQVQFYSNSKTL